jgi:hypothetical protein
LVREAEALRNFEMISPVEAKVSTAELQYNKHINM